MRARRPVFVSILALVAQNTACLTQHHTIRIHLKDTDRVDVDGVSDQKVKRTAGDVMVDGTSALSGATAAHDDAYDGAPTIYRYVIDEPEALRLRDGRYTWKVGSATASTPADNIRSAELATSWQHPLGLLLPVAAMVLGGGVGLGFGVAGGSLLSEGAREESNDKLIEGAVLTAAAVGCAAIVVYGAVTFFLLKGSPFDEPLPIDDADSVGRERSK